MSPSEAANNSPISHVDPIPAAGISEILGLLEVLDDRKGREKVYTLARDLNFEFGSLLLVIKAAEMLDLVYTPGTDVVLKALGKKMIETEMNEKKKILLNQLRKLSLFQYLRGVLIDKEDHRLAKKDFVDVIHSVLPKERVDQVFDTVVNWGRWGEFLGFSQDDDFVYLDQG
ncbi:MAG: AAA-associated domain-containing protein [Bdellovibrionales bacterium]|nr:AAA-associated domain-containing protein [Bdellovibrionales bacterium]